MTAANTSAETRTAESGTGEEPPQFGRLMRKHRIRIGLTQRELADLSTISIRAIRDLEHGKARRPRNDTIRLIADGLRLGPRARADLESAAHQGRGGRALKAGFDADPPAPPAPLHPILGREPQTAVLTDELSSGAERLVTVVGLSGVGKTRLALEVATRLHTGAGFPVLWFAFPGACEEYRLTGAAEDFASTVRACVDHVFTGHPAAAGARREDWADVTAFAGLVGDQPALLVVDGAPAAPHPDRLARLLRDCPGLRLLVTAARPGGTRGERPFLLSPLEPPTAEDERDPETLARVPAVRLFLEQVRRVRPEYVLDAAGVRPVADICRRLDGLPLALRATAPWLVVYDLPTLSECLEHDPAGLLDEFGDAARPTRFRDALRHCVDRLPADDRTLLAQLSRQGGEFALDDVVALTGRNLPDCGRLVRGLLLHGAIRPSYGPGRSSFQVLNLVRAVLPPAHGHAPALPGRPGRAAAGVPEKLPPAAAGRVLDDIQNRPAESPGIPEKIA
jgi:transcriptional regulator with XRE-family HTH domain